MNTMEILSKMEITKQNDINALENLLGLYPAVNVMIESTQTLFHSL